jgi:hypothetical protein
MLKYSYLQGPHDLVVSADYDQREIAWDSFEVREESYSVFLLFYTIPDAFQLASILRASTLPQNPHNCV